MKDQSSAWPCSLRFLLAWMIAPTFFRLLCFLGMMSRLDSLYGVLYAGARIMAAGVPQDLFVALQGLLAVTLLNALLWRTEARRRQRIVTWAATGLFAVAQLYLLLDYLLYLKTGLRMDCMLLDFLPAAKSFASSAWEMGLGGLAVGLAILGASLFLAHRLFARTVGSLRFSLGLAAGLPLVGLLAVPLREVIPVTVGYALHNQVLVDEYRLVVNLFDPGLSLSIDDESAAIERLTPQAEVFERVSPEYPLLKRTLGFRGEKTFEMRMGPGERPHVVFLFMESWRARDIGVLGGAHKVSPNFDRLSKEGVLFRNFYSNGVQTTRGLEAGLFGILPRYSLKSVQGSSSDMPLIGLADLFRRRDYRTAYFYGGDLDFENQYVFLRNHNYQEIHGQDQIRAVFPDAQRTSWGYHDEYLVQYLADWLAARDRENTPGCAVAFTISHHHPFQVPDHFALPECHVEPGSRYAKFLQTFAYADHSLGLFWDELRRRGLDKKTVLFILGDHGFPMGEHFGNHLPLHNLYDENIRVPLLILAPGRLVQPAVIDDVSSQVDLLPTVMDMFQMQGLNHAVGTSLMRRATGRTAYFNSPFVLQYLGLRRGEHKYFYTVKARSPSLFSLRNDPDERQNIAPSLPGDVENYHRDVTLVHEFFLTLYVTGRIVSQEHVTAARQEISAGDPSER